MRTLVDSRRSASWPEVLMLVEHDPVLTLGRRSQDEDLLVSAASLREAGITVHRIERGGLVTYHGPGQLVAYPVFHLRRLGVGVATFVRNLEEVILSTLAEFGITGRREMGHPGAWVGTRKIASIGLAVRRGVAFHGLALNYDPDMSHFDLINPCGLNASTMTSMRLELGRPIDPAALRRSLAAHFARIFGLDLIPWTLDRLRVRLDEAGRIQAAVA